MLEIFKDQEESGITVVIGCGRLGSNIANTLSDKGQDVIVIDKSRDSFRRLSTGFGGYTIVGDCTDFDILDEAEIDKASVVVAVTNDDSVNLMVSQLAKKRYKTEKVVARIYDPERSRACAGNEIEVLCPSVLTAEAINKLLTEEM